MSSNSPIGVTFLPSEEQSAMGPQNAGRESALGEALKILSLRLPRRPAFHGLAPQSILAGGPRGSVNAPSMPGMASPQGGFSPASAALEAILRAMGGGQMDMGAMGAMGGTASGGVDFRNPGIIPGSDDMRTKYDGPESPMPALPLEGARNPTAGGVPTGGMAQLRNSPTPMADVPDDGGASGYANWLQQGKGLRRRF